MVRQPFFCFRFPGQYYDTETGLHYNWHRYYDPEVGRYVSADPIGFYGGDLNLYAYVWGNPVYWVDTEGLAGKGLNYDPNWKGRPKPWNPADKGPKPSDPMPSNWKPKGINNLPGQAVEYSTPSSKKENTATGILRCIGAFENFIKILGGGMSGMFFKGIIEIDDQCDECPPGMGYLIFDPNNQT